MEMAGIPHFLNTTIDDLSDVDLVSPDFDGEMFEGEMPPGWEVLEGEIPVPMLEVEVPDPIPQKVVYEVNISDSDEEMPEL